ncbi:MAG: tetrahydrofolate dehydrogenase/cyclohydrolase catalytic domain-containing protein [archaeon]
MGKIIDCNAVSEIYMTRLSKKFSETEEPITLATILTNEEDINSRMYQGFIGKDCEALGITHLPLSPRTDSELEDKIDECNENPGVKGILLFNPLGRGIKKSPYVHANRISYKKDVEGFSNDRLGLLAQEYSENLIVSPTAKAIVEVLRHHSYKFGGTATIINRSNVVGKPLRMILEDLGMTVFAAYVETDQEVIEANIRASNLIVTSVPDPQYRLPTKDVPKDSIVIGVNPTNIDEEILRNICDMITSKSNPIGRATRKITLANLLMLVQEPTQNEKLNLPISENNPNHR